VSMSSMFYGATSFNKPLNGWNISNVKDHDYFRHQNRLKDENMPRFK